MRGPPSFNSLQDAFLQRGIRLRTGIRGDQGVTTLSPDLQLVRTVPAGLEESAPFGLYPCGSTGEIAIGAFAFAYYIVANPVGSGCVASGLFHATAAASCTVALITGSPVGAVPPTGVVYGADTRAPQLCPLLSQAIAANVLPIPTDPRYLFTTRFAGNSSIVTPSFVLAPDSVAIIYTATAAITLRASFQGVYRPASEDELRAL